MDKFKKDISKEEIEKFENEEGKSYKQPEPDLSVVFTGSQALEKAPEIYGVPTGIEGLDDLFFIVTSEKCKIIKKSLSCYQTKRCFTDTVGASKAKDFPKGKDFIFSSKNFSHSSTSSFKHFLHS